MPTPAQKLTYDDYAKLPSDGKRYEVIDGELFVSTTPVIRHQVIVGNLLFALHVYLKKTGGGTVLMAPLDVVLSDDCIVQPDVIVINGDRASIVGAKNIQGPPHLIIEVLSEDNRRYDEIQKRRLYESVGVDEYWVVDPETSW